MNSQATSISANSPAPWRARISRNKLAVSVIVLFVLAFLGFIYWQTTYVSGVEFNTRSFSVRKFSFHRDPFTNRQWTGVRHDPGPERLIWTAATFSSTIDPAISPLLNSPYARDQWDLVEFDQSFVSDEPSILIDLLTLHDSGHDLKWPTWTKDHPAEAAEFWPVVQSLVALNLYSRLPDIFEIPLLDLIAQEFPSALIERTQSVLIDEAELYIKSNQADKAKELVLFGLKLGPNYKLQKLLPSTRAEVESF